MIDVLKAGCLACPPCPSCGGPQVHDSVFDRGFCPTCSGEAPKSTKTPEEIAADREWALQLATAMSRKGR